MLSKKQADVFSPMFGSTRKCSLRYLDDLGLLFFLPNHQFTIYLLLITL